MKNIKKFLAVFLAAAMTLSMAACSSSSDDKKDASDDTKKEESGVKIGYISPGPDTWYLRAEEGAKWACEKAGDLFP